jgi:hypothetical protein
MEGMKVGTKAREPRAISTKSMEGLKEFTGDSSAKIWIKRARDLLELAKMSPADEVLALKTKLSQPVYTVMDLRLKERVQQGKEVNAEAFFRELLRAYGNDADAVSQMTDLLNRQQKPSENVLKYVHWFDQEMGCLDPEFKNSRKQQQLLARAFLKNLQNHRLQDALETMSSTGPCPTFSELRDAAVRMAHENKEKYGKYAPAPAQNSKGKEGSSSKGAASGGSGATIGNSSGKNHNGGKRKAKESQDTPEGKKPKGKPECWNCGLQGHKVADCKKPKDEGKIQERKGQGKKKPVN